MVNLTVQDICYYDFWSCFSFCSSCILREKERIFIKDEWHAKITILLSSIKSNMMMNYFAFDIKNGVNTLLA